MGRRSAAAAYRYRPMHVRTVPVHRANRDQSGVRWWTVGPVRAGGTHTGALHAGSAGIGAVGIGAIGVGATGAGAASNRAGNAARHLSLPEPRRYPSPIAARAPRLNLSRSPYGGPSRFGEGIPPDTAGIKTERIEAALINTALVGRSRLHRTAALELLLFGAQTTNQCRCTRLLRFVSGLLRSKRGPYTFACDLY